jgi:F0F1-type ATP synthase epsilon subunit
VLDKGRVAYVADKEEEGIDIAGGIAEVDHDLVRVLVTDI